MRGDAADNQARWVVNSYRWRDVEKLAETLKVPVVVATVLAGRGFTDPNEAQDFLECRHVLPDPFLFGDMEGAVDVIASALAKGRRIVVHGDYDTDGITATALMLLGLRALGGSCDWYLPSRFEEGFGLSRTAVERICAEGPCLLITVDCGVNYPEEVAFAKSLGCDVVVIDHHQPGPRLPECHVIHPAKGRYPHGDLCGVGLALKVLHALQLRLCGRGEGQLPDNLYPLLDLVALGTIADLAPLRGENRWYVKEGLKLINIGQRVGLRALAAVAACEGAVDSMAVSYRLAPRLNAAGRLADPTPPLRLLLSEDEAEARALAQELHELNGERQNVERQILEEAIARVEEMGDLPPALVIAGEGWHEGVVGIVAARLVERYYRPAILLSIKDGAAKGSGRSIASYDLMAGLAAAAQFLTVYGGHSQAAGLALPADNIASFRRAMESHAASVLSARDLARTYKYDAILSGREINTDVAVSLGNLGPFGPGNPAPRLLVVDAQFERSETTRNGAHLRLTVAVDGVKVQGIAFRAAEKAEFTKEKNSRWALGVELRAAEWQGVLRPELSVHDMRHLTIHSECRSRPSCDQCVQSRLESTDWTSPGNSDQVEFRNFEAGAKPESAMSEWNELARLLAERREPGLGRLAQVLATGEPVVVLTCSALWRRDELQRRLPLDVLFGGECGVNCVCRGGTHSVGAPVTIVDWELLGRALDGDAGWAHVVAIDPPFKREHGVRLRQLYQQGLSIHLCYGREEQQLTARYLRYLIHPRFAMVCLYRAWREGYAEQAEAYARAAERAWEEARVLLTSSELARAAGILHELGIRQDSLVRDKLDARTSRAYAAAEAEYQECLRICQIL